MSFDVPKHRHLPIELYGTEGSLIVPDPNRFGGQIEIARTGENWRNVDTEHAYADGNYRILGLADMAHAIRGNRPHRASGALALHVLEVMEAFGVSAQRGQRVDIATRPDRPEILPTSLAAGELD
jgi:predicted dehydrogenase